MSQLLAPLVVLTCAFFALRWALDGGHAGRWAMDLPNERSLHVTPTPRMGGALTLPWALAAGLALGGVARPLLLAAFGLLVLSFFDDRRGLPVGLRFGGHLVAATVIAATSLSLAWPLALLAILAIGWMTNLYNFMDGADGLAGSMAVTGFAAYAAAAWLAGDGQMALVAACLVASNLAFLVFNRPPARIFMGDTGSIPLGFLAGALGVLGWDRGLWPAWFPLLAFSPFVVDASVTLLRRAAHGDRVWRAHREHAYQRLVRSGWSHRRLLHFVLPLMLCAAASAVALRGAATELAVAGLAAWGFAYLAIGIAVERRRPMFAPDPRGNR